MPSLISVFNASIIQYLSDLYFEDNPALTEQSKAGPSSLDTPSKVSKKVLYLQVLYDFEKI